MKMCAFEKCAAKEMVADENERKNTTMNGNQSK